MFNLIHNRRGATAFEFALVLFFLIAFIVTIFDVSRYALTWYSVNHLAYEAVRLQTICYSPLLANVQKSVTCPSDPLTTDQKQKIAPALFAGDLIAPTVATDPTVTPETVSRPRVITAQVTGFKPAWLPINPYPDTLTVTANLPF